MIKFRTSAGGDLVRELQLEYLNRTLVEVSLGPCEDIAKWRVKHFERPRADPKIVDGVCEWNINMTHFP